MIFLVLLVTIVLILSIALIAELHNTYHSDPKRVNKFPGPKYFPFFGNFFDVVRSPEDIFVILRDFALKYYPSYKLWSCACFGAVNIVGPEDMQLVLSNVVHNEKSAMYLLLNEWLEEGLLTSSGEKWQYRRKLLTPTFHFNILKQFVSIFNKHANTFCANLSSEERDVNVLPFVHSCSLRTIAETAMGTNLTDEGGEKKYRNAIHRMGELSVYRIMRPWFYFRISYIFSRGYYEERLLLKYLKDFTKNVIKEREENFSENILQEPENDCDTNLGTKKRLAMLDLLISAKQKNQINMAGVVEEVDTFMFEGHDTISMAISFCYMLLACNKDAQDKIYEELKDIFGDSKRDPNYEDLNNMTYMEMCIKESLRLYPSVPLISRVAGEDIVTSAGHVIPKGFTIILHIYDTHRNPDLYPNPDKFDPERFLPEECNKRHPYAYLPFSAGSRNCIGQKYAMLSLKTMLAATIRTYELLPVDTPETITLIADIVLRSKDGIKMRFKHRNKQ